MLIGGFDVQGSGLVVCGAATVCVRLWIVQVVVCVVVEQQCFGCKDGRVQLRAGIQVLPVQVDTPGISPAKKETRLLGFKKNKH